MWGRFGSEATFITGVRYLAGRNCKFSAQSNEQARASVESAGVGGAHGQTTAGASRDASCTTKRALRGAGEAQSRAAGAPSDARVRGFEATDASRDADASRGANTDRDLARASKGTGDPTASSDIVSMASFIGMLELPCNKYPDEPHATTNGIGSSTADATNWIESDAVSMTANGIGSEAVPKTAWQSGVHGTNGPHQPPYFPNAAAQPRGSSAPRSGLYTVCWSLSTSRISAANLSCALYIAHTRCASSHRHQEMQSWERVGLVGMAEKTQRALSLRGIRRCKAGTRSGRRKKHVHVGP